MGIFNTFTYSDGTLYGNFSKLEFSVEPFTCQVVGIDVFAGISRPRVDLFWSNPSGSVFGFRIVRNQEGYSESEEDGHIIFETFEPEVPDNQFFSDQFYEIPLTPGRYAYYTIWVLLADNSWYPAGGVYTLIPTQHSVVSPEGVELQSSEYKFAGLLPRVYTSQQRGPLDEINTSSDLFLFLSGFAFTFDEILTFADLLAPNFKADNTNPNFVSVFSKQLGLPLLPNVSLKTQKRLIRDAVYLHQQRGTSSGIGTFVEAITSFAPTVTTSPNLLLNPQESTFYKGVGNWKNVSTNATFTALNYGNAPSGETYAVDESWVGKYRTVSTSSTSWLLGFDNPLLEGIPVQAETEYTFSFYAQGTGTGTTGMRIFFFDRFGTQITNYEPPTTAINSTWTKYTYDYTTPAETKFIALQIALRTPQTAKDYLFDMIQVAETADPRSEDFHEARAVEVYLAPNKVNWIENPSFIESLTTDPTDWDYSGLDSVDYVTPTTVPGVLDGSHMVELTTVEDDEFAVSTSTGTIPTGYYYTFSVYAKAGSGSETITLGIAALDADDVAVEVNSAPVAVLSPEIALTNTWQRYSVTLFLPESEVETHLLVDVSGTGAGNVVSLDAAQVESGYTSTDYFDGDYTPRGAYWVGDENSSKSIFYSNKITKLGNLTTQLPDYVPLNMAYVITSGFDSLTTVELKAFSS